MWSCEQDSLYAESMFIENSIYKLIYWDLSLLHRPDIALVILVRVFVGYLPTLSTAFFFFLEDLFCHLNDDVVDVVKTLRHQDSYF